MTRHQGDDFPVLRGTIAIRSPRNILLLAPFEFCIALGLWVTSIVFTIWPEALEHAPVSFEQRGFVHHLWHYALLLGSTLVITGMLSAGIRRLQIELVGLFLIIGCLGLNLIAVVAESITNDSALSGLAVGLRTGVIIGMAIRAGIVIFEPTVHLGQTNGHADGGE